MRFFSTTSGSAKAGLCGTNIIFYFLQLVFTNHRLSTNHSEKETISSSITTLLKLIKSNRGFVFIKKTKPTSRLMKSSNMIICQDERRSSALFHCRYIQHHYTKHLLTRLCIPEALQAWQTSYGFFRHKQKLGFLFVLQL